MFGHLAPTNESIEYRSIYARCCQHQRKQAGISTLPFLSYESVFAYAYWLDAHGLDVSILPSQRCCRLKKAEPLNGVDDESIAQYCTALTMVLTQAKIQDDLRDNPNLRTRLTRLTLATALENGLAYFEQIAPGFERQLTDLVAQHIEIERSGRAIPIEQYALPTSSAFRLLFQTMSRLPEMGRERATLERLGGYIGSAIISIDAAIDWKRDRQVGVFNPIGDSRDAEGAFGFAQQSLRAALSVCQDRFGPSSMSVRILEGIAAGFEFDFDREQPVRRCGESAGVKVAAVGGAWALLTGSSSEEDLWGLICCGVIAAAALGACQKKEYVVDKTCWGQTTVRERGPCDC